MSKDKVILKGLAFYGYHGLFASEKELGQKFFVDVELYMDTSVAGKSDNMHDGVHYGQVYDCVKEILEGESIQLIESIAERVAAVILEKFDLVKAVTIKVMKPEAPIPGQFDYAAVEIYRER